MKKLSLALLLVVASSLTLLSQRTITGKIIDENNVPLIGASVLVKGTATGTVTDVDGNYSVEIPEGATALIFSYTGYDPQEIAIGTSNVIDVTMSSGVTLQDIIVVGYGTQSERFKVQSVSQVDAEKLQNRPLLGPQELLQGQAAGVQMVSNGGILGSNATVRIRGAASINAGGDPLYVVDGVPLNDGTYSSGQGGAALNPLADINPNDIESISVLKDAGAAAIYGSRGSNGVILITTKKGKAGVNRVNAEFYTGWSEPTYKLDMMNADEFRTFEKAYNNRTFPETSFDWPGAVLQTGRVNSYTLNFSGGNDITQYYLGGSFLRQSSYAIGNDLDRLNGRLNFKHTFSKKFRFGANVGVTKSVNNRIGAENNTFAPLTSAYLQLPTVAAYDATGNFTNTGFIRNVIAIEALSVNDLITDRITTNAYLQFDLMEGLTLKTDWGIDNITTTETSRYPNIVSTGGTGSNDIRSDDKWLTTNTINFDQIFGNHAISAVAGFSFETALFERTEVAGSNFAADALRNVASAATPSLTRSSRTEWALLSQFVRANYRLKDKYILEGALRRDGSSRFGANNRYGVFWAVSGGWVLSEEAFLRDISFLNTLKLSASYGTTGNDRIGNFQSLGLYGSGVAFDYAGLPGIGPNQPANPDLKWEETSQLDIGVSVELFNRRLAVDVNYYLKNTTDMLLDFQLADPNGFSTLTQNAGEMQNRGVDLNIETVNIRTSGGFEWTTNLNIGFLENEVTSLPSGSLDAQGNRFIGGANQRAVEGYTVNTFYLPRYVGINSSNGNAEYLDATGNIATSPSPNYRVIVGSAIPDFTGGFTNNFTYKGIDLGIFFNFTYGNEVYLGDFAFTENPVGGFNKARVLLNYWTESNREGAFAPAATSATKNTFGQASTRFMLDGSFLRLRNVTLGYTLPAKKVNAKFFQSARIYVMGQNLWTRRADEDLWEGRAQDPEVGYASSNTFQGQSFFTPPQAKTITVGLNASF
ncbi:MAG: TonB-dependent receptor [Saprospiraceae bacterium]|nr:TonB-dependent receptor [Saprospiraceae bacterium]